MISPSKTTKAPIGTSPRLAARIAEAIQRSIKVSSSDSIQDPFKEPKKKPAAFRRRARAPSRIRTCDPRFRRPMLYPAEPWVHFKRARTHSQAIACGERGIRTLDKSLCSYTRLAGERLQPLGHLSKHPSVPFSLGEKEWAISTSIWSGGGRIRTHGDFRHSGFQDRRHSPLGHSSVTAFSWRRRWNARHLYAPSFWTSRRKFTLLRFFEIFYSKCFRKCFATHGKH